MVKIRRDIWTFILLNLNVMYLYMCVHCDLHAFQKPIHELDEDDDDIAYTIKCKFFLASMVTGT